MNKAQQASVELRAMDELAAQDSPMHRLSPLSKLFVTVLYIVVTVSFHKYDISGVFVMVLFPLVGYQVSMIPVHTCFHKLRVVMPLVCAVGLFNPFFDKQIVLYLGAVGVSGGVISMLTLMGKGLLCLMASFLLMATTPIDSLCAALRKLHVPGLLVTLLLLTYRYIGVMTEELAVMTEAYALRAPGQKGIHVSAWGSFLGQLLLRSMDRAQELYSSMLLRGYHEHFHYAGIPRFSPRDGLYTLGCTAVFLLLRFVPLAQAVGSLFVR